MVPSAADEELAGARAHVAGLAQDRLGRVVELLELRVGQERGRRLLDQLLVPPLQRAVPGRDDHDGAVRVGQALGLHVPRPVQVPLDEALAVTERHGGLADRRLVLLRDLLEVRATLRPRPPPPNAALIATGSPYSRAKAVTSSGPLTGPSVPGASGAPTRLAISLAFTLSPSATIAAGGGPIQVKPASMTALAKPAFSARKP